MHRRTKDVRKSGTRLNASKSSLRVTALRDLNRATLARQMLLAREPRPVPAAVQRLIGLQAQLPGPPYVGLWTRLAGFQREDLARRIEERTMVRAPAMRATLHVMTAEDYAQFRPLFQPAFLRGLKSFPAERLKGIDFEAMEADGRRCLAEGPRTFNEIREYLGRRHPKLDVRMMGYVVRLILPLVQVPGSGAWGFDKEPAFALAADWLGRPMEIGGDVRQLVRRYLAAFGPAAARDIQTWSGMSGLRDALEELRPDLVVLTDKKGREWFDLPEAPRPAGDTPSPPRFLPEFDNLLLGHADRLRVVPDAYRPKVFLPGLRVAATILVDGFVAGTWKIERKKDTATVVMEPFAVLPKRVRQVLEEEAERLARFAASEAKVWEVKLAKA